ncbi:C3a anaphylatoxin chemotactic receptor-like [Lithobates pipiens]
MLNASDTESSSMDSNQHVFTILIMVITTVVGIPGNFLVLWVIGMKMKWTVMNIWFWNLALADMTCCLAFPFFIAQFFYEEWLYGPTLCKMLPSIVIFTMFASVFSLVAISVYRCILVVQPVWARNHCNLRMAWITCLAIWMLSFLMCLPAVLYRTTYIEKNLTLCGYQQGGLQDSNGSDMNVETYVTFPDETLKRTRFVKAGNKTTKVVFGIAVAFFVSWAPYHIMGIIVLYFDNLVVTILDLFSQALAETNSCINPVLYVLLGKAMKTKVRKTFHELIENLFNEEVSKTTGYSRSRVTMEESIQLEEQ